MWPAGAKPSRRNWAARAWIRLRSTAVIPLMTAPRTSGCARVIGSPGVHSPSPTAAFPALSRGIPAAAVASSRLAVVSTATARNSSGASELPWRRRESISREISAGAWTSRSAAVRTDGGRFAARSSRSSSRSRCGLPAVTSWQVAANSFATGPPYAETSIRAHAWRSRPVRPIRTAPLMISRSGPGSWSSCAEPLVTTTATGSSSKRLRRYASQLSKGRSACSTSSTAISTGEVSVSLRTARYSPWRIRCSLSSL